MPKKNLNINGNWKKKKAALSQKFSQLTDDDLSYTKGEEDQLVRNIQERLGVPEDIAAKIIRYS